ncbi:MAG: HipA domain-containing protein [Candidatus Omnitrophica bacterium]|nr:HipA domain-containing protein [Candidatus Omnitrophota bacterium]
MSITAKIQGLNEVVDVSDWKRDEATGEAFPEGSREKALYVAPSKKKYNFIIPLHHYLFKLSFSRYPEQFWGEIIAYKIGILVGVEVPPTFVAINKNENKTGALIEWFLGYPFTRSEVKASGALYMQLLIKDYDIAKGKQHNFQAIRRLFEALKFGQHKWDINWVEHWTKVLAFDTLIGNTDRHQDNWGIIWKYENKRLAPSRVTPIFDNGTSMGHEILENHFTDFDKEERIRKYISRGSHHMKWDLQESQKLSQVEFLQRLIVEYPEMKSVIAGLMKFDTTRLENDIMELTKFKVPCPLSYKRAKFIVKLLAFRQKNILSIFGN